MKERTTLAGNSLVEALKGMQKCLLSMQNIITKDYLAKRLHEITNYDSLVCMTDQEKTAVLEEVELTEKILLATKEMLSIMIES